MADFNTILFDLDGTLTDSAEGILNCVKYALDKMDKPLPDGDLNRFIGPPLTYSFSAFCKMSDDDVKEAVRLYRVRYADIGLFENRVYDGVPEMLEKLKNAGKRLAVATSKPDKFAERILEKFGLLKYFDFVGGASFDGKRNDKDSVMVHTIEHLGVKDKSELLMVGDRKFDIESAHKLGIKCMAVLYGYGSTEEFEKYNADYIVGSPKELADMIIGIKNK